MKGMELCRRFYDECVRGIMEENFAGLLYSAGLLGFGSDILGYDDDVSQDHDWGPRLYIFLCEEDAERSKEVFNMLGRRLPASFCGYPVCFDEPDIKPRITVGTYADYLEGVLGVRSADGLSLAHWLAFSEHKLLTLQKGQLFRDDLEICREIEKLRYYPEDVWTYLLMSDWSCLAEERAFVKRTSSRGDNIGSRLICARLAQRIMHLCFLYEKQYAAYPKWFGTQFNELESAKVIGPLLDKALGTDDQTEREEAIAMAQAEMINIHNNSGIAEKISAELHSYYTRDILVADSDLVYLALVDKLKGTSLEGLAPVGNFSAVGNLVVLTEDCGNLERIVDFYRQR